ncbi:MAG: helix-turn-helix domain-containing protein [Planctomycetota bacterium]
MRAPRINALVVDLARSSRKEQALSGFLSDLGLAPRTIRDTKRAHESVASGKAQLVFLLLGKRGSPALQPLLERFHRANADVPAIVLTPRPHAGEAAEAVRGHAFDYLSGLGAELDECVQRAIREKGYAQSLETRLLETVGERLRRIRQDRNLTLKQLAHRTGLSVSLISQIELARSSPSLSTLFKVSRALRVRLEELFSGY